RVGVRAIQLKGVYKSYDEVKVYEGLDFEIERGFKMAFVGRNGAGKSTLVHVLADLVRPTQGVVRLLGRGYDTPADTRWIRRQVGFLISDGALFEYLTGREMLDFLVESFQLGSAGEGRADELTQMLNLDEYLDRVVATYSSGNRKKLAISAALIHDPQVIVLDEPFESLDPMSVVRLREHLGELASAGRAILVTSHILSVLESICHEVVLIYRGRAQLTGSMDAIRSRGAEAGRGSALEALYLSVVNEQEEA
ncbi:MAG: ABC transporter ATP-binding protein, partial [Gemmatimonadetes bacterium]|nr:ABC transporter ATP-binding protein [Gemmatimonadota bacterium]